MRDLLLYGPIEHGSARIFVNALDKPAQGKGDIRVRINSPGGSVADGVAIYHAISKISNRVVTVIEGVAYSMASVIALAGRECHAFELAQVMIHNPETEARGNARVFEAALGGLHAWCSTLVSAYVKKTGRPESEIRMLMDGTTFFSASEAKEFGFVDTVLGDKAVAVASFDATAWAEFHAGRGPMPAQAESAVLTVGQIREVCPTAGSDFIVNALENGWTLAQAQTAHIRAMAEELAQVRAERAVVGKAPGVEPLGAHAVGAEAYHHGDPVAAWNEAMNERIEKGLTRVKAVSDIARTCPEIRAAYLAACNHG